MVVSTIILKFGKIDLASSFIITTKYEMSSRIGSSYTTETDCTAADFGLILIWNIYAFLNHVLH